MSDVIFSDGGWVESLYRVDPKTRFRNLSELKEEDYRLVGSPVPLRELTTLYDVLLMLQGGGFLGMPREPTHGDVLQIVLPNAELPVRSYAIIDVKVMHATMQPGNYRIEIAPGGSLGMLQMPHRFSSFWRKKHLSI